MELCIVKVKTNSDYSFRKKVWAIKIWKILENKGEVLVFRVCALCLSSTMESSRLYMWQNLVECT